MAVGRNAEQSDRAQLSWLLATALVPVVALGVRYLTMPYGQLEDSGILLGPGLFVLTVATFFACGIGGVRILPAAAAATGGLVGLVALRVVIDTAGDPTSHNLWPFEIGLAIVLGGLAALLGAFLGGLLRGAAGR